MNKEKNWLIFGCHPLPNPDTGIFWRILQHCEIGHFSTIWLISPETVNGSSWKFHHKCNFGQGSIWKSSGSRVQSRLGGGLRSASALVSASGLLETEFLFLLLFNHPFCCVIQLYRARNISKEKIKKNSLRPNPSFAFALLFQFPILHVLQKALNFKYLYFQHV